MNMPWTKFQGPAKTLVAYAVVLLVSAGLCGVQLALVNMGNSVWDRLGDLFMVTGVIELIAILISVVVGFISLLVWAFQAISSRRPKS